MTKFTLFRLKNALLIANIISNTCGIMVIAMNLRRSEDLIDPTVLELIHRVGFVSQRRLVHYFFSKGGLSTTEKTVRIRIRTRLLALMPAINVVPLPALYADVSNAAK